MGSLKMNREEEKVCVKWSDFQENAISSFGILREDREFADVTLACEDGQQVEAHKVILASSSPFFLNLLRRNKHPHPLIYMRGLKSEDLVAMMDFLYFGEANVSQENLDSFLSVAEELQLKGLMGSGAEEEAERIEKQTTTKKPSNLQQQRTNLKQESPTYNITNSVDTVESSHLLEGTVAVTDYTVAADLQDLDDEIKSMIKLSENKTRNGKETAVNCKVCGNEGRMNVIKQHIEANHITGVSHTCNICGATTRSRHGMKLHKRKNHTTK